MPYLIFPNKAMVQPTVRAFSSFNWVWGCLLSNIIKSISSRWVAKEAGGRIANGKQGSKYAY